MTYDTLGTPVQVNGDLNVADATFTVWDAMDNNGDNPAPVTWQDLCVHDGELWFAGVDAASAGVVAGPYVKRWNGASWIDMGFPAITVPDGSAEFPNRPAIASDGAGSVFVAFVTRRKTTKICPVSPEHPGYGDFRDPLTLHSRYVEVWRWDGSSWAFAADYPRPDPTVDSPQYCVGQTTNYDISAGLGGDVGGFGPYITLAAKDGSHVVLWTDYGTDLLYCVRTSTGIIHTQDCNECTNWGDDSYVYNGLYAGVDGTRHIVREQLFNSCTHAAITPEVPPLGWMVTWDDNQPILAFLDGPSPPNATTKLVLIDARDNSILVQLAGNTSTNFAPWVSPQFGGTRYVTAHTDAPTHGGSPRQYMYQSEAVPATLTDLDGDPALADVRPGGGAPPGNSVSGIAPEQRNIWVAFPTTRVVIAQYERSSPPYLWPASTVTVPPAAGLHGKSGKKGLLLIDDTLYTSILDRNNSNLMKQQVWSIPILQTGIGNFIDADYGAPEGAN